MNTRSHVTIPYRQQDHGDFDAEWPPHRKVSGWWYVTGYLADSANSTGLYSYQFTMIKPCFYGLSPYLLQLAVTDLQTGRHRFTQKIGVRSGGVYANASVVSFAPYACLEKQEECLRLTASTDEFELDLTLGKGKGAVWHGQDGVLVMGAPEDPQQRTVYYSYTNMPTAGQLTWKEAPAPSVTLEVAGKSWCDPQWGPYRLLDAHSHWEWFSLRFYDDEEIMLFAFPQQPYLDGAYIDRAGHGRQVRDYTCTAKAYVTVDGTTFSSGWDVTLPGIKAERYEIRPLMEGQLNLAYFELLAEIVDPEGKRVGLCFVELLPGARNPDMRFNWRNLVRRA